MNKVLLIGWSSATWALLDPFIADGSLPNLKELKEKSTYCSLRSSDPSLSVSNWTSVTTGCPNSIHGITRRENIKDGDIFPLSSYDVPKKNIFEIVADHGKKSIQISVPVSHPFPSSENVYGISDYFQLTDDDNIKASSSTEAIKSDLDVSIETIDEKLSLFIDSNNIDTIKENYSYKYTLIEEFIRDSIVVTRAFDTLSKEIDWTLCGLIYQKLDSILFHFIQYLPRLNDGKSDVEYLFFKDVIKGAFTLLDKFLHDILQETDVHTNLYIVSPNGYKANVNWIEEYKNTIDSCEYAEEGMWLLHGKDYEAKELHFDANILDVAPTIMAALEIKQSKDWRYGKIFLDRKELQIEKELEPYDKTIEQQSEYEYPQHIIQAFREDLRRLYNKKQIDISDLEELHDYFAARSDLSAGNIEQAIPIIEKLWRLRRYNQWYGARLVGIYINKNDVESANRMIDEVIQIGGKIPELHLIKANMLILQKKYRSAAEQLEIAGENKCNLEGVYAQIASSYAGMNFPKQADKYFKLELELSKHPKNHFGYGGFLLQQKRLKQAITCFEDVVEIIPKHPLANYYLGTLLYQTNDFNRSAEYLEIAKANPASAETGQKSHQLLVDIYKNKLKRPDKIKEMRDEYEKSIGSLGDIIIVSGLPRSGTSMMMQMLSNGGIDIFTDGKRTADENNSRGYLEHEAIKNLAKDKNILIHAKGKAVKVISHLLKHLPHVFKYKIVFMDREIHEVMKSQSKMLNRLGKDSSKSDELMNTFDKSRTEAIEWCKSNPKYVDFILISYNDIMARPLQFADKVNQFLGDTLDVKAMASVVDKSLYREKFTDGKANR